MNTEFRVDNEDFCDLLGFQEGEEASNRRWPTLAPVLYIDSQTQNPYKAFQSNYIKSVCYAPFVW